MFPRGVSAAGGRSHRPGRPSTAASSPASADRDGEVDAGGGRPPGTYLPVRGGGVGILAMVIGGSTAKLEFGGGAAQHPACTGSRPPVTRRGARSLLLTIDRLIARHVLYTTKKIHKSTNLSVVVNMHASVGDLATDKRCTIHHKVEDIGYLLQ